MANFDDFKISVEAISGGKNTVLFDDVGMPSVMYGLAKMKYSDVITGGTQDVLPCFIVDGVEKDVIYISKFQNIVKGDRAYSLPLKDPRASINFDDALQACRRKGNGWGLCPGSAWTAVALWCKKNGTMPHGNNNYGCDSAYPHEKGTPTYKSGATICRTATGSGPVTWNHNFADSGISDMNGNVWEWTADLRMVDGEIQIIPNANCMRLDCNMGRTSAEWKAIMPDGSLVNPGTAGTLKINGEVAGNANKTNARIGNPVLDVKCDKPAYTGGSTDEYYGYLSRSLETFTAASGVNVPQILKAYGVFPIDSDLGGDILYVRNYGERLPFRGGNYGRTASAGVFALLFGYARSYVDTSVGFRSAFVNL